MTRRILRCRLATLPLLLLFATTTAFAAVGSSRSTVPGSWSEEHPPSWGVELSATGGTLGPTITGTESDTSGHGVSAVSTQLEYQPTWAQRFGVLGVGPSFSAYPVPTDDSFKRNLVFAWSFGGQARYQARYFADQIVVPMVAYGAEYWTYRLQGGGTGRFLSKGPTLGAWLLLNALDPSKGHSLFSEYGISRCYAVAELRALSGSDQLASVGGNSYHFGLRFEF